MSKDHQCCVWRGQDAVAQQLPIYILCNAVGEPTGHAAHAVVEYVTDPISI
jgi:hypothetical protein